MIKLLFFITEDWYFYSHRLTLAQAAVKAGYDVAVITHVDAHREQIESAGIKVIALDLQRRSLNPLKELKTLLNIISIYRREQPDIVHHVAMKPVLYGSIAAFFSGTPRIVNALAGMGYLFISESSKARILRALVTKLLRFFINRNNARLIVQNPDDVNLVVNKGIVDASRICLIRGSGVDTSLFQPLAEPPLPVTVMLPARLLYDKGVVEFVEAASFIVQQGLVARFVIVGACDPENPASISEGQLHLWQQEQFVELWGHQKDMPSVLRQAHIVCLPSYREGLPKCLLEAAACAKPIVATDVPGCREIVRNNENGLLVPAHDAAALAAAIKTLIENPDMRCRMGKRGREMVEQEFSQEIVIEQTLKLYREMLDGHQ